MVSEKPLFTIDDPRSTAKEAPYTYWLPPLIALDEVVVGDCVKLIFIPLQTGLKYDAERMWVTVKSIKDNDFSGELYNHPSDIPGLEVGALVEFNRHHIIDINWSDEVWKKYPSTAPKQVWDRCLVDDSVLGGDEAVHYLYREEPDMTKPNDKYPDSGWRIRGNVDGRTEEENAAITCSYIAIGKVLNKDDRWLHLLDEPIGSRFIWDDQRKEFTLV